MPMARTQGSRCPFLVGRRSKGLGKQSVAVVLRPSEPNHGLIGLAGILSVEGVGKVKNARSGVFQDIVTRV